jgi:YVTN family beta-propeller protein
MVTFGMFGTIQYFVGRGKRIVTGAKSTNSAIARPRVRRVSAVLLAMAFCLSLAVTPTVQAQNVSALIDPNDTQKAIVGIAVNPTQNYVYVTQGDGNLTILNAATGQVVVSSAPGTSGAGGMATYFNNVFVANVASNSISAYFPVSPSGPNGQAFQQTFSDPNGITPTSIVVDPSGTGKLFVSNSGSNNVSVFTVNSDTGLWQQVATLSVGLSPQAMAINHATHKLYVADLGDSKVWIIDASNNAVLTSVTVGGQPRSIAVNEVTNKIYVPGFSSNDLTVIDGVEDTTQTVTGIGTGPGAVAVNPLTNQIFVANITSGTVSVVNGLDNTFSSPSVTVGDNTSQAAIVVDPQTNVAYVSIKGGNLTAVNGTGMTPTAFPIPIGAGGLSALALNPVTHKLYASATNPVTGTNEIAVVDGGTDANQALTVDSTPWSVAVNPATNKIYVANNGENTVSIIDGSNNSVTSVNAGTNPYALAIDASRNLIYVSNLNSDSVTIIDGSTNQTNTQPVGTPASPDSLAVNPVLQQVYGAASGQNVEFSFQSNFNPSNSSWGNSNTGPIARATNPATGMVYTLFSSRKMDIDDGAAPHSFDIDVCGNTASVPTSFAVNTQTDTVYVACASGEVDAVQGANGFFGGNQIAIQDPAAVGPVAIAVNSVTNQIFVANAGPANGNGSVTIIDGATNNFVNVPVTGTPVAIAVNIANDKVYVQVQTGSTSAVLVIDGISTAILDTITSTGTGNYNGQIAADPVNGKVYATNRANGKVLAITDHASNPNALATTAQPFSGNTTNTTTPTFTFTVNNQLDSVGPYVVYYQIDSQTGVWDFAGNIDTNTFAGVPPNPITPGFHMVYAYAVNGGETGAYSSGGSLGSQRNPQIGAIASYGFLVAPPIAGVPHYPEDFGTTQVNVATSTHEPILVNDGGAPMTFSYNIGGPNASDFQEVASNGDGTACNTLQGILPAGSYCIVFLTFNPASTGTKNASLTFIDNSLGVAGSPQGVTLTGVAQSGSSPTLTVNFTGTGSGSVADGNGFNCSSPGPCTHSYASGASVTLTATAQAGSIFFGWTGACTGTGPCVLTMNSSQAVTAKFSPAGASSCAPGDSIWIGGASGNWSVAGNWSTGVVPNGTAHVCINNATSPASAVTLNVSVSIGGLTIDPGNSLTIATGQELNVAGTISNSGEIIVLANNGNTFLTFNGAVTLTGGGTLTLTQVVSNGQPILRNSNNGSITNVNNLIRGAGQFGNNGLIINNQAGGVINANLAFPLLFNSGTVTNTGLLEATAGGKLNVNVTVVNQNGTITSTGTNSAVQFLSGTTVQGGTVSSSAGGVIGNPVGNNATIDGTAGHPVTIAGTYTDDTSGDAILAGTITNTGVILVNANNGNAILDFSGNVTLNGGGTVTLSQAVSNGQPVLRNQNNGVLNNVNNLIQGSGQIGNNGLIINNQPGGVINANGAFPLQFNSGTVTNQNLIEATGGGTLQVSVLVINNGATLLSTGANSTIQLNGGTTIRGGTFTSQAGGFIGGFSTVTLDGATAGALTLAGTYVVSNGTDTILVGTINNTGVIQVPANNANTLLDFSGPVTLTGGGTISMPQSISNGQPILRNQNNGILNNVNNLIQGSGQIGNNGLIINNQPGGVINANGAFPLQFNSGTVTNQNLIEATGGGTLQVSVLVINNGSTLLSTGSNSAIQLLGGANIRGGTFSAQSGGFIGGFTTVTLDGATSGALTLAGTYVVSNGTDTVLVGTINNTGVIQVPANNANTLLDFSGPVTLTGGGTISMPQSISNGQPILRNQNNGVLNNVNNLIQGSGQIGNNGLIINNQASGVINANGAFPLLFNSGTVTNLNLIEATGGGTLQIAVTVINKNATLLSTGANSAIQLVGGATIEGGTFSAQSGGFIGGFTTVTLDGSTQGALTLAGTYVVSNGTDTVLVGTINNTGVIQVPANNANTLLDFSSNVTLTGGGTITMAQSISNGQPILRNQNNGVLNNVNNLIQGSGQIGNNGLVVNNGPAGVIASNGAFPLQMTNATFTNQGLLIDNGVPSPGVIPTTNYTQASTGRLEVTITAVPAGPQASVLQNSGTATLSGNLDVVFHSGYVPALGDHFTVLTSGAISGQFAAIDSPGLPAGLGWSATYNATSVVITVVTAGGGPATLTVTDTGTGNGTVTDDLGLISCTITGGETSGTCSASYGNGSIATLTATPAAGSDFTGWSACAGTGPCSVTLNGNQNVSATFAPTGSGITLNVSLIGTGNGTITDNLEQISCTNTAGVTSGTCSASYPPGTIVNLSASATQPSTFGGWLGACTGNGACSVTLNSSQAVTASFVPPPQMLTLPFSAGTPSGMATFNCPSNPNPTPNNPCLDPNAHALALGITQVNTPFTLTVQATEVPPNVADGLCPSGATPAQDFDCRFKSFFTYQTLNNGDTIVPLCYPYANGNCVHYTVYFQNPGTEPDPSSYTGPVNWTITWNNDHFVPPAPYTGGTPRLYDDPDGFVMPNSPYGTDCSTPMQIGNPGTATNPAIFCQFVFDITTFYDPNKKVDAGIGGKTKVFNDVIVAIPPANAGFVTVTSAPDNATVTAGSPIGFTITIANTSAGTATNATLNDLLPAATGLNWSISPAYTGPGTCSVTGAVGNQALNCSFGNVAANTPAFSVHILSPSSSVGPVTNSATVVAANQQVLSIASVTVQAVSVAFSGLTPSQSITVGTSAATLGGVIGNGNAFPTAGETVSVTINGITHPATIGSGGVFTLSFPTAAIPASATAYPITYSFPGDSTFGPASDSSTALTVNPVVGSFSLTVTLIGTGNGTVTDNFQQINCTNTAGVTSGTCSHSYTAGTVVNLTASATQPSTFGGWLGACTGTGACSVTLNSSQAVTASFIPPPQILTLPFSAGTTSGMVTYNCPSNPNPTPNNPCLDPNAHALALGVSQVNTPFTMSVQATEVPPNVADGLCPSGATPTQDFDCRFKSFFTYQTLNNGAVVPLCYPYANGNCVHYTVFFQNPGTEPDPSSYTGPVNWTITWNNDHFIPPAPYTGGTPRLYDDPDGFVMPNSPYGTDCSTAMKIGNPGTPTNPAIFCQFVFDITTFYDPNKKVDAGIGGKTKVFNDVIVAIPPADAGFVTVTSAPDAATVTAGSAIGFTITIANTSAGTASNASLSDLLPAGTNINWSISPAYTGPGSCSIAGAVGSQTLACSFGNVAANATPFSVHVLSASSSAGTYISASTVTAANQQILSIANVTVQALASLTFSALTPSQSITFGTATVTLAGKLSSGTSFPAAGEKVTVAIGAASQQASIGSNGMFTTSFPTATIPVSTIAYPITYSFAGDTNFGPENDATTTLTVTIANQTVTFGTTPTTAAYGSTFAVSASASSGLPVTIAASGICTISGSTVTMASGAGTCTLTATQAGNTNYKPASAVKTVTATKANSTAAIVSNTPNPSNISQAVTISVSVTGVTKPTGTVSVSATTGESCSATLSAGNGSCTLTFLTAGSRTITASYPGDANFNLSTSAGVTQTVNPAATSALTISPSSVDFGQVLVGWLAVKTVTLTNTGTTSIKISNVAINKPGFSDNNNFYALALCPSTLAARKTCTVFLTFIPGRNQAGPVSASLLITDNAAGSPQKALLTATAINPIASLNPGSLSFGTQKVGTTSAVKSVTLTNSGTTPLILGSLASSGDFAINSTTTCTAGLSIAPAHTCRIDVKFTPKSKGSRSGSITIKDNALSSPQNVWLSGQGN